MQTTTQSISNVLALNATSFFIPPFQRAYAWGRSEIERYFSDVLRIIESELNNQVHDKLEHFFGTLVIKEEKEGFSNKSIVVDGQQRLTTTLIFLIALRDYEDNANFKESITNTYLINNSSSFEDKIKLKQVTKDWDSYRALINGNLDKATGIIKNAYLLFTKLIRDTNIKNPNISPNHYITAIGRMNVAVIFLDERPFKGEDPQIIFETLNSLGKPLSLSDLIRNYVLLNMDSNNQSLVYENIWHPEIELILKDDTSEFLRDYLQLKLSVSVKTVSDNNTKEIYQIFKTFVENNFKCHKDFINDIVRYSKLYNLIISINNRTIISDNIENDAESKELLRNIFHDIKAEAFKPLVLGLLEKHQNNTSIFNDQKLNSILKIIRTYLIRRRILGLTQGENKEIPAMCKHLNDIVSGNIEMIDLLSNLFYRLRMPNDKEMRTQFNQMNFYELKKYSKFILGKIEEHNSKVSIDFRSPLISIEHVMPQKLNPTWIQDLGDNYEYIHNEYVHNLGNLILTEFNGEMGNKSFLEKKLRLEKSNLNYRCFVINQQAWNEEIIKNHLNIMETDFLNTFPLPEKYQTESNWNTNVVESSNIYPLDQNASDIVEYTKPNYISIEDEIFKVKSWQDVLITFYKYIKNSPFYDFEIMVQRLTELSFKNESLITWKNLSKLIDVDFEKTNKYKNFDGKTWDKIKELKNDELFIHINMAASIIVKRIAIIMDIYNISNVFIKIIQKKQ